MRTASELLKTIVVSLIFLPIAAVVLLVPLVRLAIPVWPAEVEERLDPEGRPVLEFAASDGDDPTIRSRPLSAAVLDREGRSPALGYVVAVRDPSGRTRTPPEAVLWWPAVEHPGCDLGLSVERVLIWHPCSDYLRVHHPNRMTTLSRSNVALDRLLGSGRAAAGRRDDRSDRASGGSADELADELVDESPDQSTDQSADQSAHQSTGDSTDGSPEQRPAGVDFGEEDRHATDTPPE